MITSIEIPTSDRTTLETEIETPAQVRAREKAEVKLVKDRENADAKAAREKREKAKEDDKRAREDRRLAAAKAKGDASAAKEAQRRITAAAKLSSKVERPSACTDTANAERFARDHKGRALFVPQWNLWLVYDGRRWAKDPCGVRVGELSKLTVRTIYAEAKRAQDSDERRELAEWASYSEAKKQRESMTTLARSEPGMAVDFTKLDAHPTLLNLANGTLDLVKGQLRPHSPADRLTKLSPVKYDAAAACPRFEKFLSEIMMGDAGSVEFLRRFLGYCLTGSIREHTMCFWHGESGGNGKSTLAAILFFVLGDLAIKAAPDLLFRSATSDRHPTELADLHGARLVVCNETSAKRTWDESTVKDITGGDPIKARRMREDFWQFTPTHKVVVFGNAKPTISNTNDGGLKRRLRLVPFEVTFSGAPDKTLDVTLRKEASGVLRYLLAGCMAWQKDGLTEPTVITEATADYFAEQDTIGRFVAERCDLNPLARVPCAELRMAVEAWAFEKGEEKPSPKDVAKWLGLNVRLTPGEKLATSAKDAGGRVVNAWRGIRLRPTPAAEADNRAGEKRGESGGR
jgi:putative DNA primase/helicase